MGQQYDDVKACLEANRKPLQLHEMQSWIKRHRGSLHAETAISARIREIRRDLERARAGTISHREVGKGKRQHEYWLSSFDLFTTPRETEAAPA